MTKLNPGAFRVWDKESNCYSPRRFVIESDGRLMIDHFDGFNWSLCIADKACYTIERFTGFYDANDKPVFEGDVIRDQDGGLYKMIYCDLGLLKRKYLHSDFDIEFGKIEVDFLRKYDVVVGTIHDQEVGDVKTR